MTNPNGRFFEQKIYLHNIEKLEIICYNKVAGNIQILNRCIFV